MPRIKILNLVSKGFAGGVDKDKKIKIYFTSHNALVSASFYTEKAFFFPVLNKDIQLKDTKSKKTYHQQANQETLRNNIPLPFY